MSDPRRDPSLIAPRVPHQLSEEQLLALVVAGRGRREPDRRARAQNAWHVLVARNFDRVAGLVAAFRFPGHENVTVPPSDHEDAAQEAFIRALAMFATWQGEALGQFRRALRTCVSNTCMDYCRRAMTREMGLAGSLEETLPSAGDEDARTRFDAELARIADRRHEQEAGGRDDLAALAWKIGRLPNEKSRDVIRLSMEGFSSREISDRLGETVDNVDQLRSRGLRELRRMGDDDRD